jgi:hypothetical protein
MESESSPPRETREPCAEMVQARSKGQDNCMNAPSRRLEAAVREMQRPRTVEQRQGYIRQMSGGTPRKVLGQLTNRFFSQPAVEVACIHPASQDLRRRDNAKSELQG